MKCAIPGMYGRKVPIESSTIRDDFIDEWISQRTKEAIDKITNEEINNQWKKYQEQLLNDIQEKMYISYGRGSGKTQFQDQMFKEYMEQLIQKDKGEHEKWLMSLES